MPTNNAAPRLRAAPAILAVSALIALAPSPAYADDIRNRQWHLSAMKANDLHKITKGEGVTIAVIDTGVNGDHPDLAGNVVKGTDFTSSGDGFTDVNGHGTAMASLIVGHGHGPGNRAGVLGIAPAAKIMPVRTSAGTEPLKSGQDRTADAVRWAVDHGAQVINMSGRSTNLDQREAITYALDHDVVVVAAAGNTTQHDRRVLAPARYPGVIAVSGTDRDSTFSNTSVQGKEVVLAAPAVDITTAGSGRRGEYSIGTGTSNSTALVAAAAALIRAKYPQINAATVIHRLIATADDRGPKGRDPEYGYGNVDPLAALTAKIKPIEINPLLPAGEQSPTTATSRQPSKSALANGSTDSPARTLIALGVALGVAAAGVVVWLALRRRRVSAPARTSSTRRPALPKPVDRRPSGSAGTGGVRPGAPEP